MKQHNNAAVPIGEASFPRPFPWQLEYNCPVHEQWNIVHTGMLIPETHAIYVCPENCLRGVIMTAEEWQREDRFSAVMPTEKDVLDGRLEEATIEGVTRVIRRLPYRPKAVEVFLACVHHFVGADDRYIFRELERRFPDIHFLHCWMDPIMQKVGLTPEQKQRREMMACIKGKKANPRKGCVLGDNYPLPESSDPVRILAAHGISLYQVQNCRSYDDYMAFGDSSFGITRSALSWYGLQKVAERDGREAVYLPPACMYEEIRRELTNLLRAAVPDMDAETAEGEIQRFAEEEEARTEAVARETAEKIVDRTIALDCVGVVRPLSCARFLLTHGFRVTEVYLDSVMAEEKADFDFLKKHFPDLLLCSTSRPEAHPRSHMPREVLAIGPKAAFFTGTHTFVNQIESGGNWGYDGLRKLLCAMMDAAETEQDPRDIVQRKGLLPDGTWERKADPLPVTEGWETKCEIGAGMCQKGAPDTAKNPEAYRITPVYAGDVSGTAAALYEMEGLVVMHDPSGCNSTYNTHDEIRWYDRFSNILISGLTERDAVLGNDRKFIEDIVNAFSAADPKPKFIAICNSPIPFLNGTDFRGICRILEEKTGVPAFYVKTNGFHDYIRGAQEAYLAAAVHLLEEPAHKIPGSDGKYFEKNPQEKTLTFMNGAENGRADADRNLQKKETEFLNSTENGQVHVDRNLLKKGTEFINSARNGHAHVEWDCEPTSFLEETDTRGKGVAILGMTPLDYAGEDNEAHLEELLRQAGFSVTSRWSIHTNFEDMQRIREAGVLLVVSAAGLPAARYLQKRYGIPAVFGVPVCWAAEEVLGQLRNALAGRSYDAFPCRRRHERFTPEGESLRGGDGTAGVFSGKAGEDGAVGVFSVKEGEYGAADIFSLNKKDAAGRDIWVIGEPVLSGSIASSVGGHVLCPLEGCRDLLGEGDVSLSGEENIRDFFLAHAKAEVIADPLYRYLLPETCILHELPTLAYSGRRFKDRFPDFFGGAYGRK